MFADSAAGDKSAGEKMIQVYSRLMTEKVPGSETTYVEAIEDLNVRMTGDLGRMMTPDQAARFREWAVKPSDIEMDDGPLTRFIVERINQRSQGGK